MDNNIHTFKKINVKLYPIYKMFSWDLLFYYSIYFLFLNRIKNLETSEILLITSFYPIFKFVLQLPCTYIVQKLGKRNTLIIGNISVCISILLLIFANNAKLIILSDLFSAFGFVIKPICETGILYDSIIKTNERGNKFSKIEGRGSALYYYLDAITSISTGFLFVINGYLPMIFCLLICTISTVISFKFKEIYPITEQNKLHKDSNLNLNKYLYNLKSSIRYFITSSRLKSLILFSGILYGLLSILITLRSSLLSELQVPEQYFGIIFAILGLLSGFTANRQNLIHNKFRNKTLTYIAMPCVFSCIISGLAVIFSISNTFTIIIVLLTFAIQFIIKGPFFTLIKRYFSSFATSSVRTKIYSLNNLSESFFRMLISLVASLILSITNNTAYILVVIGCIFTIIFIALLEYMKTRVGLKPTQYEKKEIEFQDLK